MVCGKNSLVYRFCSASATEDVLLNALHGLSGGAELLPSDRVLQLDSIDDHLVGWLSKPSKWKVLLQHWKEPVSMLNGTGNALERVKRSRLPWGLHYS